MAHDQSHATYIQSQLARRVSQRRHALGLSIKECAQRADFSPRYWIQVEAGKANVSLVKLTRLCEALSLRIAELLSEGSRGQIDHLLSDLTPDQLTEAYELLSARFSTPAASLISLLGVRGAGKSTIGKALGQHLGWTFIELDEEIESASGLSLSELFAVHGEPYYRRLEGDALQRLRSLDQPAIIATGGSIVTHPKHFALLRAMTRTIYLHTTAEEHMRRVVNQGDQRPMRDHPHAMTALQALLKERTPLYQSADLCVETTEQSVQAIVSQLAAWTLHT
jgi:XRE family aerobic/anaerobic benzoate catabolism transcriptional regulator